MRHWDRNRGKGKNKPAVCVGVSCPTPSLMSLGKTKSSPNWNAKGRTGSYLYFFYLSNSQTWKISGRGQAHRTQQVQPKDAFWEFQVTAKALSLNREPSASDQHQNHWRAYFKVRFPQSTKRDSDQNIGLESGNVHLPWFSSQLWHRQSTVCTLRSTALNKRVCIFLNGTPRFLHLDPPRNVWLKCGPFYLSPPFKRCFHSPCSLPHHPLTPHQFTDITLPEPPQLTPITNTQDFCDPAGHSVSLSGHSLLVLFQDFFCSPLPFSFHPVSSYNLFQFQLSLTTADYLQTHIYLPTGISSWMSKPRQLLLSITFPSPTTPIPPVLSLRKQQLHPPRHSTQKSWYFLNFLSLSITASNEWPNSSSLKGVSSSLHLYCLSFGCNIHPNGLASSTPPPHCSQWVFQHAVQFLPFNISVTQKIEPKIFKKNVVFLSPYSAPDIVF